MLGILIAKAIATRIAKGEEIKNSKERRKLKKYNHKQNMIKLFGKKRYYLAELFGQWVYFAWNTRDYSDVLYQKFYKDEKVAMKYTKMLKEKYTKVEMQKVYNKQRDIIGYMLYGKGEKIARQQQPSNVIPFDKLKAVK